MKLFLHLHKNRYLDIYRLLKSVVQMPSLLLLTKDGVHQQHLSSVHVWRELGVIDFGFLCLLIALDKDLADPD